jgi:hypothetical protein
LANGGPGRKSDSIQLQLLSQGGSLPLNEFYPFDWKLTISVPQGGLVEREDALDFEAPISEYQPGREIQMSAAIGQPKWKSHFGGEFFVRLPSGRYGRFRLNLSAEKGRCEIESYLNPQPGSRNLEYDPSKEIKPQ